MHPKVRALKLRSKAIEYRALSVNEFGNLVEEAEDSLGKRIVKGYLIIWNKRNLYGEIFIKGCCSKSIKERGPSSNSNYKIKFLNQHDQKDPLSLFEVLKEDETGLYFETKPLDEVASADRVLTQLRSGTLNNFSPGFIFVWDKVEWDDAQEAIVIREIELMEGSVVAIPAELGTFSIRNVDELEQLDDDIESFISKLPKNFRMEARQLFAHQKSLADLEPLEQGNKALQKRSKPVKKGLDLDYILTNL